MEFAAQPIEVWRPDLPEGRIERIYIHWSGHDYRSMFPAYHFCIGYDDADRIVVANTHDVRENMRDVIEEPDKPYAAHTRKRNSFALGAAVMGMQGSRPNDFGEYPLTEPLLDALCAVVARLAVYYRVPVDRDHIMTHAEAAKIDGYFGTQPHERWDIARLRPSSRPLVPEDAIETGDELRARITALLGR